MTTKPKAKKFRLKRDAALASGSAPVADTPAATAAPKQAATPSQGSPSAALASAADRLRAQAAAAQGVPVTATGQTGEITSASEMSVDQEIDAIRREGLTGRQLRMARRVAQKHGLAPTSDFDAVRLLRAEGIDPFKRANMLELVQNNAREERLTQEQARGRPVPQPENAGSTALAKIEPAKLPQTRPAGAPTPPSTQDATNEARFQEIARIQRDIARRRRKNFALLMTRLAFFVCLPTFITGWYFAVIATPLYSTKSEFVIQKAEAATAGAGGLGGLMGTGLATQQDSTTVQSYLQSRDAMLRLDNDLGFKSHFQADNIDPITRLDADATNEAAYRIYKRNVKIGYDPTEGIIKMEVIATSPEASQGFSEALIGYAEERVDGLTDRVREDAMKGARENFATAESRVQEAQRRVLELQQELEIFDPLAESTTMTNRIATLEQELDQRRLNLDELLSRQRPNQAQVDAVRGDIGRIEARVAELRREMTESVNGNRSIAEKAGELEIARADLETRQLLLQQAAAQMEAAMIEANRQVRFLETGVTPIAPDEPTYPRFFENTALAFLIFAGIYLMISLTASILREQVSS